jgi:hypothetical protein
MTFNEALDSGLGWRYCPLWRWGPGRQGKTCYTTINPMKKVTLEFTTEELGILTTMASDQLFRKQFIDSKMPGFRPNREELDMCKNLVGRLRSVVDEQRTKAAAHTEKAEKKVAAR